MNQKIFGNYIFHASFGEHNSEEFPKLAGHMFAGILLTLVPALGFRNMEPCFL